MTNDAVTVVTQVPTDVALTPNAVLRCRVEELNVADQRPIVVGSRTVPVEPTAGRLEVTLPVDEGLDPQSAYGVFLHLDAGGTGAVDVGDAITTETVPVLTHGGAERVDVQLHRVG